MYQANLLHICFNFSPLFEVWKKKKNWGGGEGGIEMFHLIIRNVCH